MARELEVEIRAGRIHTNRGEDYINLTLEDEVSGIRFAEINLSFSEYGQMLAGSSVKVKGEFYGLENIGKKREWEKASVTVPDAEFNKLTEGLKWDDHKDALRRWLKTNHAREGWSVDAYLGSRDSITSDYKTKTHTLHYGYYRYVDPSV